MKRMIDGFSTRPVEMIELMINSYTEEGDTILDAFCYRGLSGMVAKRMNRKWIGIDKHFFADLIL
jgi:DNA modification methylase